MADNSHNVAKQMKNVLENEAHSILRVKELLNEQSAINLLELYARLKDNKGQLVFCGVGKSGLIGEKLASTFSSLGLSSIFLHPTEALHGDLGRVNPHDGIVFISKSGNTSEILKLIPFISVPRENRVALIGDTNGEISKHSGVIFDCSVEKEACINDLAPTTSSTVALAMGDAMAVVYENFVGLTKEGFAKNHPGGLLGKSLLMTAQDLMQKVSDCPVLTAQHNLQDAILAMTKYPVGACAVIENDTFKGIIVEGDIRRSFASGECSNPLETKLEEIMTTKPVSVSSKTLALDALSLMESRGKQIYVLPVVDNNEFKGFLRMHDLLKEGFSKK